MHIAVRSKCIHVSVRPQYSDRHTQGPTIETENEQSRISNCTNRHLQHVPQREPDTDDMDFNELLVEEDWRHRTEILLYSSTWPTATSKNSTHAFLTALETNLTKNGVDHILTRRWLLRCMLLLPTRSLCPARRPSASPRRPARSSRPTTRAHTHTHTSCTRTDMHAHTHTHRFSNTHKACWRRKAEAGTACPRSGE